MAAPSSWPTSKRPAPTKASPSSSCPPDRPSSTAPSSAATVHGGTSSTPAETCLAPSRKSPSTSMPSSTSTITADRTALLPALPQNSTSIGCEPRRPYRLICTEPGHYLDRPVEIGFDVPQHALLLPRRQR